MQGRLRNAGRKQSGAPLRRPEAAYRHRPRLTPRPQDPPPRRGHQRPRLGVGEGRPGGAGFRGQGTDDYRGRASAEHDPEGRHDLCHRQGRRGGKWDAWGIDGVEGQVQGAGAAAEFGEEALKMSHFTGSEAGVLVHGMHRGGVLRDLRAWLVPTFRETDFGHNYRH